MARGGNEDVYLEAMAAQGVMSFGSAFGRPAAFYERHPGLVWSYAPSIEQLAQLFGSYVCDKVVPHPVSFSGNEEDLGVRRRIGILRTTDPAFPGFQRFAEVTRALLDECGAPIVDDRTFAQVARTSWDSGAPSTEAQANMAGFAQSEVTTIVWPQGWESAHSAAGERTGYLPEWVVAGDGIHDGNDRSYYQAQSAWDHAAVVTSIPLQRLVRQTPCYAAMREGNPSRHEGDASYICNFHASLYIQLRQFVIGVQVAGPNLTPASVDRGFHAIPAVASDDPTVPACFYAPGDYTCVKDAAAAWWDSQASSGATFPPSGCWRLAEGGRRYLADGWPAGDVTAQRSGTDPCTAYNAGNTV